MSFENCLILSTDYQDGQLMLTDSEVLSIYGMYRVNRDWATVMYCLVETLSMELTKSFYSHYQTYRVDHQVDLENWNRRQLKYKQIIFICIDEAYLEITICVDSIQEK